MTAYAVTVTYRDKDGTSFCFLATPPRTILVPHGPSVGTRLDVDVADTTGLVWHGTALAPTPPPEAVAAARMTVSDLGLDDEDD